MIPKFENFLYPFLLELKDKDVSTKEMKNAMVKYFSLSAEDCAQKTKGGTAFKLNDRIGWCRQWLRRALFIEIPKRGIYRITQRGREYLNSHDYLTEKDLLQYEEFYVYSRASTPQNQPNTTNPVDSIEKGEEMTPTERMDDAFAAINNDLAIDLLQKVLEMSPVFFERLVLDLLLHMGYGGKNKEMAKVTPASHDGGVDGIIPEDALGLDKIYIQAKRYKKDNSVKRPEIQQFIGALDEKKANKGVFITTSEFSVGAKESANSATKKIVLIDGNSLANYMIEYNVGVSIKKTYCVKKLDSDYFEEE